MTEQRPSRIPEFSSYEEEAEFWDTHDFSDYWDEFKPVEVQFAPNLSGESEDIKVRFDKETLKKLRARAQEQDTSPTTLIHRWVIERLANDERQRAAS